MRILGVDTSLTATGLCRVDISDSGSWAASAVTVGAPKPSADKSRRAMARRVQSLLTNIESALEGVDLVVMEGLAFGAKGESAWVLPWIWGEVIRMCERHDIELLIAGTSQLKVYATGKGNTAKEIVTLAIVKRWGDDIDIADNNQADAVCLAAMGCRIKGHPIDNVPQLNQKTLEKVGP